MVLGAGIEHRLGIGGKVADLLVELGEDESELIGHEVRLKRAGKSYNPAIAFGLPALRALANEGATIP